MRKAIVAVAVCTAMVGVSAPSASAADLADATTNVCTGTAEWQVNLPGSEAEAVAKEEDLLLAPR